MYEYRAIVKKVYDGDTITVDIDLGFGVLLQNQKIRLFGLNAPEVRGKFKKEGIISRDNLRLKILNKWVTIKTRKDKKGKYGRWLGEVFTPDLSINNWLVSEGFAQRYPLPKQKPGTI
tara:strand:+ start:236 stop:589 length:354 start_codon:yes stop_codon:yes gene_type:complete